MAFYLDLESGKGYLEEDMIQIFCESSEDKQKVLKKLKSWKENDWHDLRKDKNDLPKTGAEVLCKWIGGGRTWHDVLMLERTEGKDPVFYASRRGCYRTIVNNKKIDCEGQVVAWKYIEHDEDLETSRKTVTVIKDRLYHIVDTINRIYGCSVCDDKSEDLCYNEDLSVEEYKTCTDFILAYLKGEF